MVRNLMKDTRKITALLLCMVLLLTVSLTGCNRTEEPVTTDSYTAVAPTGTYIGHDNDGITEFLGVRYAAPIERWKAPTDVTTTSEDIIEASEWGPSCIQPDDEVELASKWIQSEDCLHLNIWTKDIATTGKPVMVFIHGGGAWQGGTWDPLYNGEHFVRNLPDEEDVVMVTINYRLGIFGSLNFSSLEGYTDEYADAVNLAILDQIQSLKWINENIEAFGGDPNNVTMFGQSAGGGAICTLMAIPEANQYFHKAILESGVIFNRQISLERSLENSNRVFEILGVSSVEELLAISDKDIQDNYVYDIWRAVGTPQRVADGRIIPLDCWKELNSGVAKDIVVMIGSTDGEYDFLATDWDNFPHAIEDPEYIWQRIERSRNNGGGSAAVWSVVDHPDIVEEYLALGEDRVMRMMDLYNDTMYRQPSIFIAEALSQWNQNVYMYYWTWAPDVQLVIDLEGDAAEVSPYGRAMHCMELVFVFGTLEDGYPELAGPEEALPIELMEKAQSTWYAFAKTGNPNNEHIPTWEPYNSSSRMTMFMGEEWELVSDPRPEDRNVLNQLRP
jgi:para-nitrobenzyl esterase